MPSPAWDYRVSQATGPLDHYLVVLGVEACSVVISDYLSQEPDPIEVALQDHDPVFDDVFE